MAWIQSQQEIARNPKTKRAARALGISLPQLVGHLHILWHWCLDFAPDGDLSEFDAAEIAEAAMWETKPHPFIDALLQNGFLEETEAPGYVIADWFEIGGKVIDQKRAAVERAQRSRDAARNVPDNGEKPNKLAARSVRATSANVAQQSREEESREEESREDEESTRENDLAAGAIEIDSSSSSSSDLISQIVNSEGVIAAMCDVCGLNPQDISRAQFQGMERSRGVLRSAVETEMARGDPSPLRLKIWLADEIRARFADGVWEKATPPYLGQISQSWQRQGMILSKNNGAGPQAGKETTREQLRQRLEKNRAGA